MKQIQDSPKVLATDMRSPIRVDNSFYAHIAKRPRGKDLLSVKN